MDEPTGLGFSILVRSRALASLGRLDDAVEGLSESLPMFLKPRSDSGLAEWLEGVADLHVQGGRFQDAATALGAARAIRW